MQFDYDEAFSRNIGWLTATEQRLLRSKRVAIGGVGGVGGGHALALARLGIGGFSLADPDVFELANFNRQLGAMMSTIGAPKAQTIAAMVSDINPTAEVKTFGALTHANVDDFLRGADLYIDGLDFFAPEIRELVFARCTALGVPQITAAPLGMSVAYISFLPGGMTFEELFGFAGQNPDDKLARFLAGLAPRRLHAGALAVPTAVSLREHRGPSTAAACHLCAGVVAAEAMKILTGRGRVRAAPWCHQFDAFSGRYSVHKARFGHRSLLFRMRVALTKRMARRLDAQRMLAQAESGGAER